MCPTGATSIHLDICFSQIALYLDFCYSQIALYQDFLKCTSTSLFFPKKKMSMFQEYLMQQSLKLGSNNYNFKWIKVSGTAPY
jgi:hypothetical protein